MGARRRFWVAAWRPWSQPRARIRQRRGRLLAAWLGVLIAPTGWADNWHGSLRTKVQVDNRYTRSPNAFAEAWGQFLYDRPTDDLHGGLDFLARTGTQPDGGAAAKLYQAFVDKGFADLNLRVKAGRFERTDNLGFYLLDGANLQYAPRDSQWVVDAYAGRPTRIDHARSVDGEFVGGFEGRVKLLPGLGEAGDWMTLDRVDLRGGYQYFRNQYRRIRAARGALDANLQSGQVNTGVLLGDSGVPGATQGFANPFQDDKPSAEVHRLYFAGNASGKLGLWPKSGYDLGLLGTFRADKARFEDVLLTAQVDLTEQLRFRGSYEYYRPREPFLTFREKFYSAYALGEQTLFRARVHHSPIEGFTYYVGGMGATRQGRDGYGGDIGASYFFTPNFKLAGEFDYLGLGPEDAKSFYLSAAQNVNSQLQVKVNTALRFEQKLLYGDNRAIGAEAELFYMIKNNMVLNIAGSYIWNTRLPGEYLGAVQFIYYFDNFKPKGL